MKIDVDKLIDQVSRHPEIYNPDHRDFANEEVRENIFNNIISKEVDGINGENLQRKWDQILKKYAGFIRKLSNDDSSETVLERFMEWPWTKKMRIFKPYVRKQFQIPEFQPAVLLSEMNPDDLADIPLPIPPAAIEFAIPRPELARPMPGPRQEFPHPLSMPRPEYLNPRAASFPYRAPVPFDFARGIPLPGADFARPAFAHGIPPSARRANHPMPYMESVLIAAPDGRRGGDPTMFQDIATMLGLDQRSDEGTSTTATTDEDTDGNDDDADRGGSRRQPAAKRTRRASENDGENNSGGRSDGGGGSSTADDRDRRVRGERDVLPDLPLPKPVDRRPTDFTVQEHTFLAWAKTMSTFTAKRQAKIKMKINKIMSEAEFEDLDDEFFAANSPPRRPIYTSRR